MESQVPDLIESPSLIPLPDDFSAAADAPSGESIDKSLDWREPQYCQCQYCGESTPIPDVSLTADEQTAYVSGIRWTLEALLKISDHRTRADAPFAMAHDYAPDLVHGLSLRQIVATGATHTKHAQRLNNIAVEIRDGLTDIKGKPVEMKRPLHSGMKSAAARAKLCGPRRSRTGRKPKSEQPEPSQEPVAARLLIDDLRCSNQ